MTDIDDGANGQRGYVYRACLVATLGGLLFGYDTAVISGGIGFLKQYFALNGWQEGWAASSALLGCVIGVSLAGLMSDRFGRRRALIVAAVCFLVSAIGTALPRTLAEFVVYRALGGVGVGIASMVSPMYIAEVSPARLRGRLVSVNQIAIATGMLVVYFVNYFITQGKTEAWNVTVGWRWMFGSEAVPCVAFLALLLGVPESPRWLAAKGRNGQALAILRRIGGERQAQAEMEEIGRALAEEPVSLRQLLHPGMMRIVVIGVVLAVLQQVTGINVILYYAPKIFASLGAVSDTAMLNTIVVGGSMVAFTVVAVGCVDRWGRRPLLLLASAGMGVCLFAFSAVAYLQKTGPWALLLILGYIASFSIAMGPVVWVVLSEIFPNRVRGRALSVATFFLWIANYLVSQTFPVLNDHPFLVKHFHHAFPFWVYGSLCVIALFFIWRWIPETKGRTLEEIEQYWKRENENAGML
ncbi:MAG: sugar porter family MFS transporter [Kiritimatiellia bacterium]|jgi:SP family xylose:H+ symportor-like MFS transporter|nr:sugar porter family MFS transporter [Kiritimatiellia bacterium]